VKLPTIAFVGLIQFFLLVGIGSSQPSESRIEVDGLILNQAKTRTGHEFFRQFAAQWEPPSDADEFNIVIIENATPQWGSIIQIKVNEAVVFLSLAKPGDAAIKELAGKAVERVGQYLTVYVRDLEKYKDDDLATSGW
jgi:curli production assembly/transport component CsgE